METYIYALVDPRTDAVRYVGKANDPKRRLCRHIRNRYGAQGQKDLWLADLKARGLRPVLRVLETVGFDDWPDRERYWIAYYRRRAGADLLNVRAGGLAYGGDPRHPEIVEAGS